MAASELPQWRAAGDLLIVDVRPVEQFRRVRIPGSINVRAHALKTKSFLSSKRLLLVNAGGSGAELESVCEGLHRAGFASVGILEGGLAFWSRHVGRLEGDLGSERALNRLSPAQVVQESGSDGWLVFQVGTKGSSDTTEILPGAQRIGGPGADGIRNAIEAALNEGPIESSRAFVLVANRDGEAYAQLEDELKSLDLTHLYFLEGGVEGYRAYENQRKQIAMAAARGCPTDGCGAR